MTSKQLVLDGLQEPGFDRNLSNYDIIIIAFSGGKDSLACVLYVLELIQQQNWQGELLLWHHLVDGVDPNDDLMDWPCTGDYCQQVAAHLGIPLENSWLENGFKRELLKVDQLKAPTWFETPWGLRSAGGKTGKPQTRRRYPQQGGDLMTRWCTPYLKIDVADIALCNQPERFNGKRTLFISGERREESPKRRKYKEFEVHSADLRNGRKYQRHIDHWRAVIDWSEAQVWEIIGRWGIVPHPCYWLGFGRCSCMMCIFASDNQMATLRAIAPSYFFEQASYEAEFGVFIDRRRISVEARANRGQIYPAALNQDYVALAMSRSYTGSVAVPPYQWRLPAGAYGEQAGPS